MRLLLGLAIMAAPVGSVLPDTLHRWMSSFDDLVAP
jgi:hypothetical protein